MKLSKENEELIENQTTHVQIKSSSIAPRIIAGSIGSLITALAVTPLEVVKVRQQALLGQAALAPSLSIVTKSINNVKNEKLKHASLSSAASIKRCPDCGVFILNNGLMECLVPKSTIPYFQSVLPYSFSPNSTCVNGTGSINKSQEIENGTFRLLRSIFQKEGFKGIYAGLTPTLVMSVPNTVLYFTTYDELSHKLRQYSISKFGTNQLQTNNIVSATFFNSVLTPLICGSSARLTASVCTAPLELIRTRQALQNSLSSKTKTPFQSNSLIKEFRIIIQTEGLASLFKGLTPTLYRDVPFSAIYWLCVEQFRSILTLRYLREQQHEYSSNKQIHSISPVVASYHAFISGALSGMIAAFCTTPFDVVKTRQQVNMLQMVATEEENIEREMLKNSKKQNKVSCCSHLPRIELPNMTVIRGNTWMQLREIAAEEGVQGLWRGNLTRMIKVAPACAIMISSYEFGKRILDSA